MKLKIITITIVTLLCISSASFCNLPSLNSSASDSTSIDSGNPIHDSSSKSENAKQGIVSKMKDGAVIVSKLGFHCSTVGGTILGTALGIIVGAYIGSKKAAAKAAGTGTETIVATGVGIGGAIIGAVGGVMVGVIIGVPLAMVAAPFGAIAGAIGILPEKKSPDKEKK